MIDLSEHGRYTVKHYLESEYPVNIWIVRDRYGDNYHHTYNLFISISVDGNGRVEIERPF